MRRQEKEAKREKDREDCEERRKDEREAYSGYPYIKVGKSKPETELPPLLMKEDCVKCRTLTKRFMASGHRKYQAHRKAFNERHLIWIETCYKGPANLAETICRPYIIED